MDAAKARTECTENCTNEQLFKAIGESDAELVSTLLKNGVDPNYRTSDVINGRGGALHSAVRKNDFKIVKCLLDHGADVDIEDEDGDTPLFSAVYKIIDPRIKDVLISCGANRNHRNKTRETPLIKMLEDNMYWGFAFTRETFEDLFQNCTDLGQRTTSGIPLLHPISSVYTCRNVDEDENSFADHICVRFLSRFERNSTHIYQLGPLGRSTLFAACSVPCLQSIRYLLDAGIDVNIRDIKGQTAMHLLGRKPNSSEFSQSLELIHEKGLSVNDADCYGRTLLHYISSSDFTCKAAIDFLIEKGANINAKDKAGMNSLHFVVLPTVLVSFDESEDEYHTKQGAVDVLSCLVKHGIDVNDVDKNGFTPLHLALRERNKNVIKTLLSLGSDPNLRTRTGENAIHRATIDEEIFKVFIESTDLRVQMDVNSVDDFQSTPAHWAVWYMEANVLDQLRSCGAKFNKQDITGKTATELACFLEHSNVYQNVGVLYHRNIYPLQLPSDHLIIELNVDSQNECKNISLDYSAIPSQVQENVKEKDNEGSSESDLEDEGTHIEKEGCTLHVDGESNYTEVEDEEMIADSEVQTPNDSSSSEDELLECHGNNFLYPECPLLMTIYDENKSISKKAVGDRC